MKFVIFTNYSFYEAVIILTFMSGFGIIKAIFDKIGDIGMSKKAKRITAVVIFFYVVNLITKSFIFFSSINFIHHNINILPI